MAETQMTEHLLRFVTEISCTIPYAKAIEQLLIEAEGGDPEANREEESSESSEEETVSCFLKLKSCTSIKECSSETTVDIRECAER